MNNGYAKIKLIDNTKSRSMEISDLMSPFPQAPKKPTENLPNPTSENQKTNPVENKKSQSDSFTEHEEETDGGEREFDLKLSRSSSVSSSASVMIQSTMKRAFSMRRSSSVSERYCRIHDQSVSLASPIFDDDEDRSTTLKKKHSKGKIFKACKKLFGL